MFGDLNVYNIANHEQQPIDVDDYLGENPNVQNEDGNTVLHKFIINQQRDNELLQNIINNEANLEIRNSTGKTAFLLAVIHRNMPTLVTLLLRGADINAVDDMGHNAIHFMALPELNNYFRRNNPHYLQPGRRYGLGLENTFGYIRGFVRAGVNINSPDNNGETPLMWAARGSHLEIIQMLLVLGADVHDRNINIESCLHLACTPNPMNETLWQESNSDIMSKLIRERATVNSYNRQSRTPLGCILYSGHQNRAYFAGEFIKVASLVHWDIRMPFYLSERRLLSNLRIDLFMRDHAQACFAEIHRMRRLTLTQESNLCQLALSGLTDNERRNLNQDKSRLFNILLLETFTIYQHLLLPYLGIDFLRQKVWLLYISSKFDNIPLHTYISTRIASFLEINELFNLIKASVL